jgi:hypothetical protein
MRPYAESQQGEEREDGGNRPEQCEEVGTSLVLATPHGATLPLSTNVV